MLLLRFLIACWLLVLAGPCLADAQDSVQAAAARNQVLVQQIANAQVVQQRVQAQLEEQRATKQALETAMARIERRAAVHALGQEFGQVLTRQLRQLPRTGLDTGLVETRRHQMAKTSDDNFELELELGALADIDAALDRRIGAGQAPELIALAREALLEQRDLLARLDLLQKQILTDLKEVERGRLALERQIAAARTTLSGYLFWLPAAPSLETVGQILPALAWTVSPSNWRAAGAALWDQAAHRAAWSLALLVAVAALLLLRGRLQGALASCQPSVVSLERYGVRHALAAVATSLALALPGPLLMWIGGTLLSTAPGGHGFVLSLGDALLATSKLLLALLLLGWLLNRRGLAVGHLGWDASSLGHAAGALRAFSRLFVPLLFLAALNGLDFQPRAVHRVAVFRRRAAVWAAGTVGAGAAVPVDAQARR